MTNQPTASSINNYNDSAASRCMPSPSPDAPVDAKQPMPTSTPPSQSEAVTHRKKHLPQHRNAVLNSSLTPAIKLSNCGSNPHTASNARAQDRLLSSFDTSFTSLVNDLSISDRSVDFSSSIEIYYYLE